MTERQSRRQTRRTPKDDVKEIRAGSLEKGDVVNKNPEYFYTLVSKNDDSHGIEYYQDILGFEVVTYQGEDSEYLAGVKREPGKHLEHRGHVLMRAPLEQVERTRQFGSTGRGGLRRWNETMKTQRTERVDKEAIDDIGAMDPRFFSAGEAPG